MAGSPGIGYISVSMVFSNGLRALPAVLVLLLAGCLFDSGGGSDAYSLDEGHYSLGSRFDQSYFYDQYLVVLGGNRFEWVEYGYSAAAPSTVCRVTRKAGDYTLADSSVKLSITAEAPAFTKCGMSKADFQALILEAKEPPTGATYPLRNREEGRFESKGLFGRAGDWLTYAREKDPFGFYQ
jgi:hypothetical protein